MHALPPFFWHRFPGMDNTHHRWEEGGEGDMGARPPRESAHLKGRKGITSLAETKGAVGVGVAACRHALPPSPAPRDGAWRATCNRPPLFSLACPRARRESCLPYKFADRGRKRGRGKMMHDAAAILRKWWPRSKGPYIKDVRKIFGFLDPLPPCPHFCKTVCPQNRPIFGPLGVDVLN